MSDREKALVRIDATGTAHPVGREASRQMRSRQGNMRLLPAPPGSLILRDATDEAPVFWLAGQVTRAGILWELMSTAGQGNWTGELVVENEGARRTLYFERGSIVGSHSNADRERLGEVMYHYGLIEEAHIQTIASAVTKEMRFGEAAVSLGYVSNEQLFDALAKQTEEVAYATTLVGAGTFYFIEGFDDSQLSYRLNLNVQHLLMEGVRRMDEIEMFRARIPSELHVPEPVDGASVDVSHEHYAVWAAADGLASIEDLARITSLSIFDATRAVFQLLQSNVLVLRPPRPTGAQAIVTLFNQAIALIVRKVDEAGGGDEVREQLSSFATASGVYDALFRDAGPARDGTLDPDKIADTIEQLAGQENPLGMLAQWLYEYASFAMFIAEPLLRSKMSDDEIGGPISEGVVVSRRVAEMLAPLAPDT